MEFLFSVEMWGGMAEVEAFSEASNYVEALLNHELKDKNYGNALTLIAIVPIIVPHEHLSYRDHNGKLFNSERKLFKRKSKEADYRLHIDHDKFMSGSKKIRIKMLLGNAVSAIIDLDKKAKGKFDGQSLIKDIEKIFEVCNN